MKLYSWNVNGIRAVERKNALRPFVEEHQPDILCIQETKAQPEQIEVNIPGYETFWHSAERPGHFGTGFLTREVPLKVASGLPKTIVDLHNIKDDGYGDPSKEGRVIAAEFSNYYLVNVYTPNAKDDLTRLELRHETWDPAFLDYVKLLDQQKPVIFCGDLNVAFTEDDLARPKENDGKKGFTQEERQGFQNMLDDGFIDTFRLFHEGNGHYSWWSHWGGARERNVGWRIDYFMVSEVLKDKVKAAAIHPEIMGSDHCPISLDIDIGGKDVA